MPGLIGAKQMYIVIAMDLKFWSLSDLDPSKAPLFFSLPRGFAIYG